MAQLKDTIISGSLRVTDTIFSTNLNLSSLTASYAVLTDANKNLVSRGITNNTSATAVTASTNLITANTLYYHKGNSNIVTVGTISSGTWHGTTIGTAYGGTGNTSFTQWGVIYANPATKLVSTAAGTSGYLLQGNGSAAPSWIQATNANTASTIVKRDASGNFSAGTITAALSGNAATATSTQRLARIADNTAGTDTNGFSTDGLNVRWYTETGKIAGQPTQYGFLFTVSKDAGSNELHQLWAEQSDGSLYHRGTNYSSHASPPAFKTILDSSNYTSYTVTKTGSGASGSWGINVTGSSGSCTGNSATASKVGAAASWMYFNHSNEVNFGGTDTSGTIYFGYRATDSRPKPDTFIFGTGSAMATVKAATFVGSLTGNCSGSSGSCTGNAATSSSCTGNSATATKITAPDTRSTNESPSTLMGWGGGVTSAFKQRSTVGSPDGSGTYGIILNLTPWGDSSGSRPKQLWIDDSSMSIRHSTSDSAWSGWSRFVTNSGTWGINVTGSSGSCTGNAATATNASYLITPNAGGYSTDGYGNLVHNSADTTNYWCILNNASHAAMKVYYETGAAEFTGTVTAPTFSGNAATATRINGNLGSISDSNAHNIWVSSGTGADGIPKYISGVTIIPSSKTLYINNVCCTNVYCPNYTYHLSMQNDGNLVIYSGSGGAVWSTGTSTKYVKENINSITDIDISNFMRINPVSFNYKPEMNMFYNSKHYGVIAEELLDIYPNLVEIPENYDQTKFDINKGFNQPLIRVNYEGFIPLLIKMVQKQQKEINELREQLNKFNI